ncbi:MAG: gluconate 5-dehydrogenase [Defluviitaleaceae bacterium]|nr:gluconate 5-dehydrogenase [Defluviitaleaceae bacterium]
MGQFSLKGKVALVTGAVHGIGFGIACAMHKAGATVVFNDRNSDRFEETMERYKAEGVDTRGYVCDVTDEAQVEAMVADITRDVGSVDILVNNAGSIIRKPMLEMSPEEFRFIIEVNLNAPFVVSRAVLPGMVEKRAGKIINICSMTSELGRTTLAGYASSKGGLKMLTKNIASEFGHLNIQCNGIGPGYIETPQTDPLRERQPDGSRHPFDSFIISKTPAERWGTVEDLTGPAVFLASPASDFINGHILYVDGGLLATIGKQPN